jgi:hypothetical protein
MTTLTCVRCNKPATIGEHDDAIGSFLACSDECHAAELAERVARYQDEAAGVAQRKRERIAAIRAGQIPHPGYVTEQPDTQADFATILPGPGADRITPLQAAMARIEGRGAERLR